MAFVAFVKVDSGRWRYLVNGLSFVGVERVRPDNLLKFVYSPEYSESSIKQLIEWFRYQSPANSFGSGLYGLIRVSENSKGVSFGKELIIRFRFRKPSLLGQKRYGKIWA